ncbi:MAG: hypothetical protein KIT34_17510 [Cyanobacteria bacterium TGS_CYA1]|nr:hypothetical protein [Cyanobacteria bacterium TGS_CYA1]
MQAIEIYCTSDEFWSRVLTIRKKFDLICFERHQRTCEVRQLPDSELNSSYQIRWQVDVWMGSILPEKNNLLIPAKEGWIHFSPPKLDLELKSISGSDFGAQEKWSDGVEWKRNEDLVKVVKTMKREFRKGTVAGNAVYYFQGDVTRAFKVFFTRGALDLQNSGWTIVDWGGSKLSLPNDLE